MSKTKLVLTTALVAFAAVSVSTEATAAKKAHKHAKKAAYTTTETHSSSFSHSTSSNAKVDALEAQLQSLQSEVRNLRAASGRQTIDPDTAKVQELDQWMNTVKAEGHSSKGAKDNMVFFRGGYSHLNDSRGATNSSGADLLVGANKTDKDAWYFGAGFDWSINDNLFGLMQGTEFAAELMFDYKEIAGSTTNLLTTQSVTTNQLTLAASPKIKFMKGSSFRPWLIPVGFEMNIISPPSGAVTVMTPGMQFGAGMDYKVWKDLYVGADARYHYTADDIDGVNTDGVTAGGYVGFGF